MRRACAELRLSCGAERPTRTRPPLPPLLPPRGRCRRALLLLCRSLLGGRSRRWRRCQRDSRARRHDGPGLRALQYVKEVEQVAQVVANDMSTDAVAALRENIRRNGISESVIVPSTGDAIDVMHQSAARRSALRGGRARPVRHGGALPRQRHAMSPRAACSWSPAPTSPCSARRTPKVPRELRILSAHKYCHEAAPRIVLSCMEGRQPAQEVYRPAAGPHQFLRPSLRQSLHSRRGEARSHQARACLSVLRLRHLLAAADRADHRAQRTREDRARPGATVGARRYCGRVHHVGGPIWSAPMHDQKFIAELLES